MQTILRHEIDADLIENNVGITDFKTDQNCYDINCRECNKTFYGNRETAEAIYRSIKGGLDNPFLCNDCQLDYEESAYENR